MKINKQSELCAAFPFLSIGAGTVLYMLLVQFVFL